MKPEKTIIDAPRGRTAFDDDLMKLAEKHGITHIMVGYKPGDGLWNHVRVQFCMDDRDEEKNVRWFLNAFSKLGDKLKEIAKKRGWG